MKFIFSIIILIVLHSCVEETNTKRDNSNKKEVKSFNENIESEFLQIAKQIKELNFPFDINCSTDYHYVDVNANFIKYKPEGSNLVGKVFYINNEVGLLYTFPADVVLPIIYVYNNKGNVERKLNVFDINDCGFDEKEEISVNCKLFSTSIIKTIETHNLMDNSTTSKTVTIKLIDN